MTWKSALRQLRVKRLLLLYLGLLGIGFAYVHAGVATVDDDQTITGSKPSAENLSAKTAFNIRTCDLDVFSSLAACVADLPSLGGYLFLLPNTTYPIICGSTQIATGRKVVHFVGGGWTSIVSGTGCALVTLSSPGSAVEDLEITDPTGSSRTVGLTLDNGSTGIMDWTVKNVRVLGTRKTSGSVGIKGNFALIGSILGGRIDGWDVGVELSGPDSSHRSNAVKISGADVTLNNTGISYPTGTDDAFIDSSTIEGNNIGLSVTSASGTVSAIKLAHNHFENNLGTTPQNVVLAGAGGNVTSTGNGFYSGTVGRDFNATAGVWHVIGITDTLNEGLTNSGTGNFYERCPIALHTTAGTGPILTECLNGPNATANLATQPWGVQGYAFEYFNEPVRLHELKSSSCSTNFDWFWADSSAHRLKMCNNNATAAQVVGSGVDINTSDQITQTHAIYEGGANGNATKIYTNTQTLLSGTATHTFANNFRFTSAKSFGCTCTDETAPNACKAAPTSATIVALAGSGSDTVWISCTGH